MRWAGAERARPAPGVLEAIADAQLVVLGPSNATASLAVPGVREALRETGAPVVAVTPVVSGVPIEDPGDEGRARSRAALLASLYAGVADAFVLDEADAEEADEVRAAGLDPVVAPTLLHLDAGVAQTLVARILHTVVAGA